MGRGGVSTGWAREEGWAGFGFGFLVPFFFSFFWFSNSTQPIEFKFKFEFNLAFKQIKQCSSMNAASSLNLEKFYFLVKQN
jgi:hypothetical protein